MMLCVRMSTCSCCARSSALRSGRTPNAITIAPDAEASSTSFSVTAPTPEPMIFSFTWSVESFGSISLSTSTEPCTSPLITIPNSLTSPAFSCSWSWSSVMREPLMRAIAASRCLPWRYSTTCLALASSVTWKRSPASGTPCKPSTSTGVDGGASFTTRPRSSNIARTLPKTDPQIKKSPAFSVPFCTRIVATGPRPFIRFANGVQQTRLPVIDVAHHRHHRRPRLQTFLGLFLRNLEHHLLFERDHAHYSTERFRKCRCCRHVQRLVDAGKHAAVEQVLQDVLGAHIQLFGQFANRDAFRNRHVARRTRLRRRDDRGRGAAACARTLPRRVQFALTFLLALIQNGTLALRRLARVKRLPRLRLRRQFLWKRRQHPRTPGCARAGARSGRHRAATLFKWPRLWSARAAGSWREWPSLSGLLWTHRLPWTRAACTRFSRCVRKRSAIPTRQWTAISCRRWPSWSA